MSSSLSHHLTEYLKKTNSDSTKELTVDLCHASPNGPAPCPIRMTEDRVVDFQRAASRPGGITIIPVLACAASMAEGDISEELRELLAKMFDQHRGRFFTEWQKIPPEIKPIAPKFDDFVMLAPQSVDDYHKKIKIFESRLKLLEQAPTNLKLDLEDVIATLKEAVGDAHDDMKTVLPNEGEITFKTSQFFENLTDKFVRMKTEESEQNTERQIILANQTLQEEGLTYKVYLKSKKKDWNICSTSSRTSSGCKITNVAFREGMNSCGNYALLGVASQSGAMWTLVTSMARSNFRVNAPELFTPTAVLMQKSEAVVKFWNVPEGFTPVFLSADLSDLFLKTTIKTSGGNKLGELTMLVRGLGATQFINLKDKKNLISIGSKSIQPVKGLDGSELQIHLSKSCRE